MENDTQTQARGPNEWVNDWDLLSPRFQSEASAYFQVFALVIALFLVTKRARGFLVRFRAVSDKKPTDPTETALSPSEPVSPSVEASS